jgi:hypothetical protein
VGSIRQPTLRKLIAKTANYGLDREEPIEPPPAELAPQLITALPQIGALFANADEKMRKQALATDESNIMSKQSQLLKLALVILTLVFTCRASFAELSPAYYKQLQQQAPESLIIKVLSVKTVETSEPQRKKFAVTVEAQVEKVERSNSGLKRGSAIHIGYVHFRDELPTAGASEVPILKKGQVYPAYLTKNKNGEVYAPAAGGLSFHELKLP